MLKLRAPRGRKQFGGSPARTIIQRFLKDLSVKKHKIRVKKF
jgi:hypothetical protein